MHDVGLWVQQTVRQFQLVADHPASCADLYERLAELAHGTSPPRNQMDAVCARYLMQSACIRMATRILGESNRQGSADWASVWCALTLISTEQWPCVAAELRALAARTRHGESRRDRVEAHLRLHFAQACRLRDVARSAGTSLRVMTGAFKRSHRCTVHQYVSLLRLRAAIRLLTESDMKIAAICGSVGWNSQADFYRHLQRHTRLSPGALRSDRSSATGLLKTLDEWLAAHGLAA